MFVQEYKELSDNPFPDDSCTVQPKNDDYMFWQATITGPAGQQRTQHTHSNTHRQQEGTRNNNSSDTSPSRLCTLRPTRPCCGRSQTSRLTH